MTSILNRSATANLFPGIKTVSVVVVAGTATKANAADAELIGGKIIGVVPSTGTAANAIPQLVTIGATGIVTVTLGANTTSNQTFLVQVEIATGDIA